MHYCPECGKTTGLYRIGTAEVEATVAIDPVTLEPKASVETDDLYVSAGNCDWDETACAECDWRGDESDLRDLPLEVETDDDGEPTEEVRGVDLAAAGLVAPAHVAARQLPGQTDLLHVLAEVEHEPNDRKADR
jgi:hypothetical protein